MELKETLEHLLSKRFSGEFWGRDEQANRMLQYVIPIGDYGTLDKQGKASIIEYSRVYPEGGKLYGDERGLLDPTDIIKMAHEDPTIVTSLEMNLRTYPNEEEYTITIKTEDFKRFHVDCKHVDTVARYATFSFRIKGTEISPDTLKIEEYAFGNGANCISQKTAHKIHFIPANLL